MSDAHDLKTNVRRLPVWVPAVITLGLLTAGVVLHNHYLPGHWGEFYTGFQLKVTLIVISSITLLLHIGLIAGRRSFFQVVYALVNLCTQAAVSWFILLDLGILEYV